jgi:flagellar biosynthesis anti-sigma factor FlgM
MRINGSGNRPSDPSDRLRNKTTTGTADAGRSSGTSSATGAERGRDGAPLQAVRDTPSAAVVVSSDAKTADASRSRLDGAVLERLQAVKAAIAGGNYAVDFDKLASRLVDDELARGGR